ncbi:MAG TPA: hypothetical protein VJP85_07355 [Candidatus Baltobacteraceae bacterium]|nr:hypothetical protein [Candidatus Baltobacteraceae bacterium]
MPLELLNTLASIGTFVVIGATAIAAVVQLRHLRANNQLEGLLDVLARVEDETFNRWLTDTQRELPQFLSDPHYVRSVLNGTFDRNVAWLQLGNQYERVGSLLKHRLIPEEPFMEVYSLRATRAWEVMLPMTSLIRYNVNDTVWENFEFMYVRAKGWIERHQHGSYPNGLERAAVPRLDFPLPAPENGPMFEEVH